MAQATKTVSETVGIQDQPTVFVDPHLVSQGVNILATVTLQQYSVSVSQGINITATVTLNAPLTWRVGFGLE